MSANPTQAEIETKVESGNLPTVSIALLSACALAYEVLLMRLFSIIQWHHFAYMIISLALLGYGVSGTFLTLSFRRISTNYPLAFVVNIVLFAVSALLLFLVAQHVPFNAQEILWDAWQVVYLLLLYVLLALPFFFAANAIGMALMHHKQQIPRLYAADMLGAGVGAVCVVLMLFFAFPQVALQIIASVGVATAIMACWELRLGGKLKWLLVPLALAPFLMPASWTGLILSPYKELSQTLHINGAKIISQHSSPLGSISVVENRLIPFRHMPGLSLNATTEAPPQLAMFTDGDSLSVINGIPIHDTARLEGNVAQNKETYLDQLTSALPYNVGDINKVLVLGAGGGSEVLQALYYEVEQVDVVELNAQIVKIMQHEYASFSGNLYNNAHVRVHVAEGRGFVSQSKERYDLIQVSLLDAFGASAAGLYALNESYLYTVEALKAYMQKLNPNGLLAITRWINLPPRNTLKMFATAVRVLEQEGLTPAAHLILIRSWQTSTLLIKRTPISVKDIALLQSFCEQRAFDLVYYPGMPAEQANRYNKLRQADFYQSTQALLGKRSRSYIENYKFNIDPATDDKPYFFNFFKWSALPEIYRFLGRGGMPLLEWGYLILVATLIQAVLVSVVLIVFPLLLLNKPALKAEINQPFPLTVVGYFLALGLAFLFMEIAIIQKFILLLHHPLYSVVAVLASFLIFAALGSRFSKRYSEAGKHFEGIRFAVIGIALVSMLYLLVLEPMFFQLLYWPIWVKIFATVACIAPLAFCMGMPFPLGLSLLGSGPYYLIPWAWGINGCASVLSAVLATLLAIQFGFTLVILMAVVLYGVAVMLLFNSFSLSGVTKEA